MRLAVCGDSWFTSDWTAPGKSFGEIICFRNNWELLSLARGGCSNFTISLQVDKAIELNSDFVILGTTTPDRCEFPLIDDERKSIWDNLKNKFNYDNWDEIQPETYDKSRGISNIWHNRSNLSKKHKWIDNPTIISESLSSLIFGSSSRLTKDQLKALKEYLLNLYDDSIKRQVDTWIISDACRRLEYANIPYVIFVTPLYEKSKDFLKDISWVGDKKIIKEDDFSFRNYGEIDDTPFHYSIKSASLIADYFELRIKNLGEK